MFSEALKKLGKSEFLGWVSEGNPIIFRNFAPCYPELHKIWAQIHTFTGKKSSKKGTLCGTIGVQKWFIGTIIGA